MEDLKKSIERLETRIDSNTEKMIANMNKLHSHEEKINANAERIQKNSYALDILKDYKHSSRRLFIILIIVLFMWFATIGYLVYVLNDIGISETTQEVNNINSIGGNVVNGDMYGED